jgi:AcrR family transcriptional regulator
MGGQAARVLALALDPAPGLPDDATAERVLDAALALAAASGLRHVTMDAVAARAGVGRMTVYRRFGSRQTLVDALAVRECRRCLAHLAAAVDPHAPMIDRAASLFAAVLELCDEHPLLARLARVEPEALLHELTRDDSQVFGLIRAFLVGEIRAAQAADGWPAADPAVLAELGIRLGASFVLMPDTVLPRDDRAATEAAVRSLLAPLLG